MNTNVAALNAKFAEVNAACAILDALVADLDALEAQVMADPDPDVGAQTRAAVTSAVLRCRTMKGGV